MTSERTPKPEAVQPNPIVAKAAEEVSLRKPDARQLELFSLNTVTRKADR